MTSAEALREHCLEIVRQFETGRGVGPVRAQVAREIGARIAVETLQPRYDIDADVAGLILNDPEGGRMVPSSALNALDGGYEFQVRNPTTGRIYQVTITMTELP